MASKAVTGCVATAMATVMRYWQYPKKLQASTPAYTTRTLGLSMPAVDTDTVADYDWENMLPAYPAGGTFTQAQHMAVARLMYHCGLAVQMDYYNVSASSLYALHMTEYFGFDKDLAVDLLRYMFTLEQWCQFLDNDLVAGRPILYAGVSEEDGGHLFVVDGADGNGLYHVDWGWNGLENGYFDISLLNPNRVPSGLGGDMKMIVGLQPDNGQKDEPPYTFPQQVDDLSYTISKGKRSGVEESFSVDAELTIATPNMSGFTGDIAIGLKKSDGTYDILASTENPVALPDATTEDGSAELALSFDYAFPEGFSEVCVLSRAKGGQDWQRCIYSWGDMMIFSATADSLKLLPSRLRMDSLVQKSDQLLVGKETDYEVTFTNISSEAYYGRFIYYLSDIDDEQTAYDEADQWGNLFFSLAPGESVTKTFCIVPTAATRNLWLLDVQSFQCYNEKISPKQSSGISIPTRETPADDVYSYTIGGQRIKHATRPGIYVRKGKKVVVK